MYHDIVLLKVWLNALNEWFASNGMHVGDSQFKSICETEDIKTVYIYTYPGVVLHEHLILIKILKRLLRMAVVL